MHPCSYFLRPEKPVTQSLVHQIYQNLKILHDMRDLADSLEWVGAQARVGVSVGRKADFQPGRAN